MQQSKRRGLKKPKQPLAVRVRQELSDGNAYRSQQKCVLTVPGTPFLLTTTITTGVISALAAVGTGAITSFAARFGSTFDEYRVLGANLKITPVAASTGVSKLWFDEKSNAAASLVDSQERNALALANTNAMSKSQAVMKWRARDLLDLQYTPIATATTPVYWKLYTDTANWGAPVAVTALWLVEVDTIIEFRGLKAV